MIPIIEMSIIGCFSMAKNSPLKDFNTPNNSSFTTNMPFNLSHFSDKWIEEYIIKSFASAIYI